MFERGREVIACEAETYAADSVVYSGGNRQRGQGKTILSPLGGRRGFEDGARAKPLRNPSGDGRRGLRGMWLWVGVLVLLHPQTRNDHKPSLIVPKPPSCAPARAAVVRALFGVEGACTASDHGSVVGGSHASSSGYSHSSDSSSG